jgi:hypothetical protein
LQDPRLSLAVQQGDAEEMLRLIQTGANIEQRETV